MSSYNVTGIFCPDNLDQQKSKRAVKSGISVNQGLTVEIETLLKMKYVLESRSVTSLFSELLQSVIPFCMMNTYYKSNKDGKDQESLQSSTTPDPGYQWENDNVTTRHHKREQEVSPFPAGDHKALTNRRA